MGDSQLKTENEDKVFYLRLTSATEEIPASVIESGGLAQWRTQFHRLQHEWYPQREFLMSEGLNPLDRVVGTIAKLRAAAEDLRKNPTATKILSLKLLIVATLITATVLFTYTSYNRLERGERRVFRSQFEAVSDHALHAMTMTLTRMSIGIEELSSTFGGMFPSEDQWPFVAWNGFTRTALLQGRVTSVGGMSFMPIVTPEKVDEYQSYIADLYAHDQSIDSSVYLNPYFPGASIFTLQDDRDALGGFRCDRFGNTTASPNKILVPIAQYTMSQLTGPNQVNYNLHGHYPYWQSIDKVIDCVDKQRNESQVTGCGTISPGVTVPPPTQAEPHPTPTDFMAVFLHPIFPTNNATTLAGFTGGTLSWRTLMSEVVVQEVEGIDCVVEADGAVFTFQLHRGAAEFVGMGDHHERRYDGQQRQGQILGSNITRSCGPHRYTLNFYPTWEYERRFYTMAPLRAAIITLAAFIFCTVLFACYDILTQREFNRRQLVLDTKRRFVRFISHEIRTPLNTVKLGMKLLEVEIVKLAASLRTTFAADAIVTAQAALDAWKTLVEEIVESSESAVEVLNDLLNYDKIEVGTLKLEFGYFDLVALVEKVVTAMKVQSQQKSVALSLDCAQVLSFRAPKDSRSLNRTVIGDALRMSQVLRNLVSNALKFTPAGGHVSVKVWITDKGAETLTDKVKASSPLFHNAHLSGKIFVSVKDSGAGLTPKQLEEICAEGVQFNANELQAGQGSGLGLFISKGIVEQHGGRLVVTSEGLGKGATFTMQLPLFQAQSVRNMLPAKSKRMTVDTVQVQDFDEGITYRLLIVDDSAFNRKMLVRLLASKGHTCEQAEDGADALKKYSEMVARNEAPDAILMDFEMPVMNGPTATAKLREMGCTCLIVGVTGNVMSADVGHFKAQGADHVLPKPLVLEDFEHLLLTHVRADGVLCAEKQNNEDDREKAPLRVSYKPVAVTNEIDMGKNAVGVHVGMEEIV